MRKYKLYNHSEIYFETPDDGFSYFFGYYDKTPLNSNNDKLLAHRVSFDGRPVKDGDFAEIGYFNLKTNQFVKIDETLAWNWQQGAQLQWMPPDFNNEIIYNSIKDNKFVSIRYNLKTSKKKLLPFPIYVIHPNGNEALSINYERHYWCRPGYNYQNVKNKKWDKPYHNEDGIYKIDLNSGDVNLIISIADIVNNKPLQEFFHNNNWLEHLMYNPSGKRFMFFHRWNIQGKDYTRLYTANSKDGSDLFMFPDTKFYSHADWKNNNEITIWTKLSKNVINNTTKIRFRPRQIQSFKSLIKPIYKLIKPFLGQKIIKKFSNQSKLLTFKDKTKNYHITGNNILTGNGHITWSKDEKKLLFDTYEDNNKFRHLMIFNNNKNKIKTIGKFYSNYNSCIFRADLHPRYNFSENLIIIDSAHYKKRKILIIKLT